MHKNMLQASRSQKDIRTRINSYLLLAETKEAGAQGCTSKGKTGWRALFLRVRGEYLNEFEREGLRAI